LLERGWSSFGVERRRARMAALLDCVFVWRRGSAAERFFVCARGDAPPELPCRGNRELAIEPFDPGALEPVRPLDSGPSWPREQVRAAFDEFLLERDDTRWPSDEEFVYAGRGPLLRQLEGGGDLSAWASASTHLPRRRAPWTEPRIRATLDRFLAGRSTWPTRPEFRQAGLDGLYMVLGRRGRRAWAQDYGLRYRETEPGRL
jgi:hypothetical protein